MKHKTWTPYTTQTHQHMSNMSSIISVGATSFTFKQSFKINFTKSIKHDTRTPDTIQTYQHMSDAPSIKSVGATKFSSYLQINFTKLIKHGYRHHIHNTDTDTNKPKTVMMDYKSYIPQHW